MSQAFANGGTLITEAFELPIPSDSWSNMYLDLETSSGDPKKKSLNPWHDCFVAGIALTVDDFNGAWYVPVGHRWGPRLDPLVVQRWVVDVFNCCDIWINHNVKYDAQVMFESFGVPWVKDYYCTLTQAKLIDSDRMRFSLDALSKDWLKEDISKYEEALQPYLGRKSKDYGDIPADICGEYACQDVLTNRRLYKYIKSRMPEESQRISDIENKTTAVLIDIERNGMKVNQQQLMVSELLCLNDMATIQEELADKVGFSFEPHVNGDCFDVLCNKYGLPVLAWNKTGNPSFDKEALKGYMTVPNAPRDVIDLMLKYRKLHVLANTFIKPYRLLNIDGLLHSSYNQTVRTGRMSCKMPNAQQLSSDAKKLIITGEGESIISVDYSQIEYRIIAHYIKDLGAIEAYRTDPFTDFHSWVADMCNIHRKPAKTVNFLMGYGGGKERLLSNLVQVPELVGYILEEVEKLDIDEATKKDTFLMLARAKASEVYTTYHDTMPGLRRTARAACQAVMDRGYIRNLYGRHRTLPRDFAHRAFNTLCQGTAADLMKAQLVRLHDYLQPTPFCLIGVVHDEVIIRGPSSEITDDLLDDICFILEDVDVDLRVPIRTSCGVSTLNWFEASNSSQNRLFSRDDKAIKFL